MLVKELADRIAEYAKEIGCDGKGRIGSHDLASTVGVRSADADDDTSYELVDIDIDQLWGCGCWRGITFVIRKKSESAPDTRNDSDTPKGLKRG